MKRVVMLLAVLLGTSVMVNANTITKKATTKEVKTNVERKHRKAKKMHRKAAAVKPAATVQK
ncbi:hypothetical protein EZL74_00260 [Flavobacterium silvisoli]|uniref:Acid-shock protein n=1 Tax=Flavobacterium silvisoli TaxID=2529433 RepID=A0A4Q9Z3H2_9FLAO|nr:hypothetical protein [Flavobacterium silvisoli]TBX70968.1 hypothetical protein EZL74_00260 [Flavobacterium silvisoli]